MTNDDERMRLLYGSLELHKELEEANTRILKLKAELAFYRGFHDGVCNTGTHVIVPVEPTDAMIKAACIDGHGKTVGDQIKATYRAMLKAAKEGDNAD